MRLFFFGSLMDGELMRVVLDRDIGDLQFTEAELLGYERRRAKGESFPIVVPTPGGRVEGRLVEGLTARDVACIQWYESDDYRLAPCLVGIGDRRHEAHLFLANQRLEDEGLPWHFHQWAATEKPMCLALAAEIMSYHGKISPAELTQRWEEMKLQAALRFQGAEAAAAMGVGTAAGGEVVVPLLRAKRRAAGGRRR